MRKEIKYPNRIYGWLMLLCIRNWFTMLYALAYFFAMLNGPEHQIFPVCIFRFVFMAVCLCFMYRHDKNFVIVYFVYTLSELVFFVMSCMRGDYLTNLFPFLATVGFAVYCFLSERIKMFCSQHPATLGEYAPVFSPQIQTETEQKMPIPVPEENEETPIVPERLEKAAAKGQADSSVPSIISKMKSEEGTLPDSSGSKEKRKPCYCRFCGAQYQETDSHCPNCGKRVQFFPKHMKQQMSGRSIAAILSLSVLSVALACGCLYFWSRSRALSTQLKTAQSEAASESSDVQKQKEATAYYKNNAKELQLENNNLMDELAFYHTNIVFVVSTDHYRYYHSYDCGKYKTASGFVAFNREQAEYEGYSPCPICGG